MGNDIIEETLEKEIINRILPVVRANILEEADKITQSIGKRIKQVVVTMPDGKKKEQFTRVHEKFDEILLLVNNNIPAMLTGGAGSGKSSTCEKVAAVLRPRFLF